LPIGFSTVAVLGERQSFQIVRASQSKWRLPEDLRSSLGVEFRVQMPVINVPFRLIFAHNPGVEDNSATERKNVVRFSVGRTF
jgi:outer membrane protein insertion porin family